MTVATAVEFMKAAPTPVGGSSPWASRYAAEIRRLWNTHAANAPRTLQQHLGPSELGVECDRQVAGKFAALPETNHVIDPWASTRGRALHTHAEDVFDADNERTGTKRWHTERKVTPHADHPGTADLYDELERAVVDHKFLGKTSMAKIRRLPPRKYRRQLYLYGLGYLLVGWDHETYPLDTVERLLWALAWRLHMGVGVPVERVAVAAYPATSASLSGLYVWEAAFAPASNGGQILPEVLAEIVDCLYVETPRRRAQAAAIVSGAWQLTDVPAIPASDECYFCPFFRPQAARDTSALAGGASCPGTSGGA